LNRNKLANVNPEDQSRCYAQLIELATQNRSKLQQNNGEILNSEHNIIYNRIEIELIN